MRQNYHCVHSEAEKMTARGHIPELGSGRARAGLPIPPRHTPVAGRLPCFCLPCDRTQAGSKLGLVFLGQVIYQKREG